MEKATSSICLPRVLRQTDAMVALDLRDLAKYPFLKEAQSYISNQTSSLDVFLASSTGQKAIEEALDTITRSLYFNPRQPPEVLMPVPSESSAVSRIISSYPVSRILVSCSGDRTFIERLCRFQAWKVFNYLQEEEPEKKEIIARSLGLSGSSTKIPVIQYIEIVAKLREEKWRLVNRCIERGIVTIHLDEIDEILRERLRVVMYQNLPIRVPPEVCTLLEPYLEKVQKVFQERMLEEFGSVEESAFPPCMQAIIGILIRRAHLTHMGRFAVTAFLHNIGMDNTRIVEIYGQVPNFDLTKTMYQVDHISGRGGSGTEYTSPLCSTMKTHALCVHRDALCDKVIHPLTYYKKKKWMIESGKKKSATNAKPEKENCPVKEDESSSPSGGDIANKIPATADNGDKHQ